MLFYLPLEPYIERYTYFMSCKDGWAEDNFKRLNVDFKRVEGKCLGNTINQGKVLDANGRSYYALTQTAEIVKLINSGELNNGDVVYVEDFWHPGIETLFYIRHLTGINFKIGTFLHAQSVDDTDFSYTMREWIRPIEIGYGKGYDFIMVTSEILKNLCIEAGIGNNDKIFNVGLPYNSTRLLDQLKDMSIFNNQEKDDYVIFSSRFDDEKDPMFFLDLVELCNDINFKLVKPRKFLTTNEDVLRRVEKILNKQNNFSVIDTSDKKTYYELLSKAKVQFNCAHQDWVSWTLLEAITFQCNPLYPIWKDFPVELNNNLEYLYEKRNLMDCANKLYKLIKKPFDHSLKFVVKKHDASWENYLRIMGVINV